MKTGVLQEIEVAKLVPTKLNPRSKPTGPGFSELVDSIKRNGVQVPVMVRKTEKAMELLAGSRRHAAAKKLKLKTIPAIVYEGMTDEEAFDKTFCENFARQDLTAIEQGRAVELLLQTYGGDVKAVAAKLGVAENVVRMRSKLKNLTKAWVDAITNDVEMAQVTVAHLEVIALLPADIQDEVLGDGNVGFADDGGPVSIADLREQLQRYVRLLSSAPWGAGDCEKCKYRSDRQPELEIFDADTKKKTDKKTQCLNANCWDEKVIRYIEKRKLEELKNHKNLTFIKCASFSSYAHGEKIKKICGNMVESHMVAIAKKSTPGALPALIVSGSGIGNVIWISRAPKASGKGVRKVDAKTGKVEQVPLKEREAMLERKRWAAVIAQFRGVMEKGDTAIDPDTVLRLAATIGTNHRDGSCTPVAITNSMVADIDDSIAKIWASVLSLASDRLHYYGPATQLPQEYVREAGHWAELLNIDIAAIYGKVSKEKKYQRPASWGDEAAEPVAKKKKVKK